MITRETCDKELTKTAQLIANKTKNMHAHVRAELNQVHGTMQGILAAKKQWKESDVAACRTLYQTLQAYLTAVQRLDAESQQAAAQYQILFKRFVENRVVSDLLNLERYNLTEFQARHVRLAQLVVTLAEYKNSFDAKMGNGEVFEELVQFLPRQEAKTTLLDPAKINNLLMSDSEKEAKRVTWAADKFSEKQALIEKEFAEFQVSLERGRGKLVRKMKAKIDEIQQEVFEGKPLPEYFPNYFQLNEALKPLELKSVDDAVVVNIENMFNIIKLFKLFEQAVIFHVFNHKMPEWENLQPKLDALKNCEARQHALKTLKDEFAKIKQENGPIVDKVKRAKKLASELCELDKLASAWWFVPVQVSEQKSSASPQVKLSIFSPAVSEQETMTPDLRHEVNGDIRHAYWLFSSGNREPAPAVALDQTIKKVIQKSHFYILSQTAKTLINECKIPQDVLTTTMRGKLCQHFESKIAGKSQDEKAIGVEHENLKAVISYAERFYTQVVSVCKIKTDQLKSIFGDIFTYYLQNLEMPEISKRIESRLELFKRENSSARTVIDNFMPAKASMQKMTR